MEPIFTIRPVVQSDAELWQELRTELWPDGVNEHEGEIAGFFSSTLLEPEAVFAAVDASDRLIGFVELSVRRDVPGLDGQNAGYIEGLYVTPMRHYGVARALIQTARAWTRSQGCATFASDRSGRFIIDSRFC